MVPSSLSVMVTSAIPIGARLREPLKMTSSIFSPRRDLALCSPRTQAIASDTLLLPQPFGPTIPVTPDSMTAISALSEKDLKPKSSMRLSFNTSDVPLDKVRLEQAPSFPATSDRLGPSRGKFGDRRINHLIRFNGSRSN